MKKTTLITVLGATLILAGSALAESFHPIADADNYWGGGLTAATLTPAQFHPIADADNYVPGGLGESTLEDASFHPIADADNYVAGRSGNGDSRLEVAASGAGGG